jgi:hypothetical protein
MKFLKLLIIITIFCSLAIGELPNPRGWGISQPRGLGEIYASAANNLSQKLSGKILLQVEENGEAWYVNPADYKKYYLGRPKDAFDLMGNLGIGITDENLEKIPVGFIKESTEASKTLYSVLDANDSDNDGLINDLEDALGTDPQTADSDNDGYDDKTEIENNYNPLGTGKLNINNNFAKQNAGKIFLQVENAGQAWYVNPNDQKRYYLGRPIDAWNIMRNLGLGITNQNLNKINTGYLSATPPATSVNPAPAPTPQLNGENVIYNAASAIREGNINKTLTYFVPELHKAIEYTMNFLDDEGRLTLGNILSGAKLTSSTDNEKIYTTEVYFSLGGYKVEVNFHVKKQEDGSWLITNL